MRMLHTVTCEAWSCPALAIVMVALGAVASAALLTLLSRGPSALVPVLVLLVAIGLALGLVVARIVSFKVSLLPDRIRYVVLPGGWELPYRDITAMALERIPARGYRTTRLSRRLCLRDVSGDAFEIPLEPFRKADVARIIEVLASRASHATIDPGGTCAHE